MAWQFLCFVIFFGLLGEAHLRLPAPRTIPRPSLSSSKHEELLSGIHALSWKPSSDAKGTFLLLHGCGKHASDFYALPQESRMATAVLDRGFTVLAPDASPKPGQCWDPVHDGPLVRDALHEFLKSQHLHDRPVYGLGISNGGAMLEYLFAVLNVNFAGLHFNVGPNVGPAWGLFKTKKHPPVAFVHMQHDPYTPQRVVRPAVAYLRQMHTPVQEFEVAPLALGYLVAQADKIDVGEVVLDNVVRKLIDWGYTVTGPGEMARGRVDPKRAPVAFKTSDYKRYLQLGAATEAIKRLSEDPEFASLLKVHRAAFEEEVHLVDGWHCPTAEHIDQSLDFLLNNTSIS